VIRPVILDISVTILLRGDSELMNGTFTPASMTADTSRAQRQKSCPSFVDGMKPATYERIVRTQDCRRSLTDGDVREHLAESTFIAISCPDNIPVRAAGNCHFGLGLGFVRKNRIRIFDRGIFK